MQQNYNEILNTLHQIQQNTTQGQDAQTGDFTRKLDELLCQMDDAIHSLQKFSCFCLDIHFGKGIEHIIHNYDWDTVTVLKDYFHPDVYRTIFNDICKKNIERIQSQEKIKVAFMTKDSAEWSVEPLYRMLEADDRFEVYVLVAAFNVGTPTTIQDTYERAVAWFRDRGYPTYETCKNPGIWTEYYTWDELPVPDICFLLNPHHTAFLAFSNVIYFPMQTLVYYIPYGFSIYGNIHDQYNQLSHSLCHKIFYLSEMDRVITDKYADMGDSNVLVSGYTKMDEFYQGLPVNDTIWKTPAGESMKRVIYAPHWSIGGRVTGFGNFDKTYLKMLEYARNTKDSISWVLRPHPMLRAGTVQEKLFRNEQEFDAYMDEWNRLPNARVISEGSYIDLFKTSDALIGDSISFLAEYQYTHKPLLFLTRDSNTFDEFGTELIKILYTADGGRFDKIQEFIEQTVLNGQDPMYQDRLSFFHEYLDYKAKNGCLASEYIYRFLLNTLIK